MRLLNCKSKGLSNSKSGRTALRTPSKSPGTASKPCSSSWKTLNGTRKMRHVKHRNSENGMKILLLSLYSLIAPDTTHSKISIPTKGFDLMYWEVVHGRSCDSLQKAQSAEILAITNQLVTQGRIITLQKTQISSLEASNSIQVERSAKERALVSEKNRRQIRRLRLAAVGGWAGVVLLVVF